MKLKTLLLTFTAAAILAVVPSQAKAQMVVPDPRACIYTGCGTVPGLCYVITTPCMSSYGGNACGGHVHVAGNQRPIGFSATTARGVHKAGRKARISRSGEHRLLGHAPTKQARGFLARHKAPLGKLRSR